MWIKILCTWAFALGITVMQAQERSLYEARFRGASLEEVFRVLEQQYQLKFAYDNEAIAAMRVDCRAKAVNLTDFLNQIFAGTGLVYQLAGARQVLVRQEGLPVLEEPSFIQISGQVTDGLHGFPLPYAHIVYASGTDGVAADEEGRFQCRVPLMAGNAQFIVQYVGYQPRTVRMEAKQQRAGIQVRLLPQVEKLPGIVVKEKAVSVFSKKSADGSVLRTAQMSAISNSFAGKDLFRSLQMLPGIDATNDLSADLSIRSSNGDENLVLLDGMTLYNVTHFFGIFSIVNPNVVDQVQVYKNAFPAEYGGRTAAIIDMRTHPMRREDGWQGVLDVNFLTSSAALEAPIGPRMSLLLGFRTANQDLGQSNLFGKTSPTDGEVFLRLAQGRTTARTVSTQQPDFYFYDANVKWSWEIAPKTNFQASYFRGRDRFGYAFNRKIYPPLRRPNTVLEEQYSEDTRWQNEGASAIFSHQWTPRWQSKWTFAHSAYENSTLIGNNFFRVQESVAFPGVQFENRHFNRVEETNLHLKNSLSLDAGQFLHLGYQGTFNRAQFRIGEENNRSPLNGDRRGPQHALYGQYLSGSLFSKFSADLSLRLTAFDGKAYFSPRAFLSYQVQDDFLLKGAYGRYQQFVRQLFHEDRFGRSFQYWVQSDSRFPVAASNSYMLGLSHKNRWFDLDVEFYRKDTEGVLEHALQRVGLPTVDGRPVPFKYVLFEGSGRIQGMDVLVQKAARKYALWVAYTLSKATHAFPQVFRGTPFPAPNDRRHQLKLNGQYVMGKFDVGATYIFASGRPYTDLSLFDDREADRTLLSPSDRLAYLEDYHRVDLFAHYTFSLGKGEGKAGINLYNLFDRENVKYRQFIYSLLTPTDGSIGPNRPNVNTVVGTELEMLGFTPNISFQWKF